MRPDPVRVALFVSVACLAGLCLIAGTTGATAEQKHGGPPAAAHPAMARPTMARPAAPAFHAAPQRPAMAARPMPHFSAPSRPAPHIAVSHPSFQRSPMASHPAPHIAASRHPSAPSTISARSPRQERQQRQERIAQPAQSRELRNQQHQQIAQQRQRDALSRRSTERQARIDRLQQRVQRLQAQKPEGRRAQRTLAAQQRLLQREQLSQKRDLAQQQKLGMAPGATQHTAAATAVQAAARGRFATRFRNNADPGAQAALAARLKGWAPRKAWRNHAHAAFVPWLGPVFWPYAYADIFDYTFWPGAYDDAYWAYAYDDLIDTAFWDVGSPYSAYASIDAEGNVAPDGYVEPGSATVGASQLRERSGLSQRALQQLCRNPDSGITAWPFAEITRTLRPTPDQRELLDQLKHAAAQAASALKNSCSDSYALTPPDRLRAMTNRISATLEAVRMVRPALEAFYNALDDEQRARFNALGPRLPASPEAQPQQQAEVEGKPENKADRCNASKSSLTSLPIERIKAVLHPTDKQQDALDHLSDATKQAVETLQAACPDEVPVTPVGRLQAMEERLSAMLQAANQLQPALDDFYASLTVEQKARFNTLQQVAAQ